MILNQELFNYIYEGDDYEGNELDVTICRTTFSKGILESLVIDEEGQPRYVTFLYNLVWDNKELINTIELKTATETPVSFGQLVVWLIEDYSDDVVKILDALDKVKTDEALDIFEKLCSKVMK